MIFFMLVFTLAMLAFEFLLWMSETPSDGQILQSLSTAYFDINMGKKCSQSLKPEKRK